MFAQNAGGTLDAAVTYRAPTSRSRSRFADVTGDGVADAVVVPRGWNLAGVYRGTGGRSPPRTYAVPYATITARTAWPSVTSPATAPRTW